MSGSWHLGKIRVKEEETPVGASSDPWRVSPFPLRSCLFSLLTFIYQRSLLDQPCGVLPPNTQFRHLHYVKNLSVHRVEGQLTHPPPPYMFHSYKSRLGRIVPIPVTTRRTMETWLVDLALI